MFGDKNIGERAGGHLDTRRERARKNMFLSAMLQSSTGNCPAIVRNLSASGAMVEAAIVPDEGAAVRLVRGSLCASGRIAWRSNSRCGLVFSSHANIDSWLAPDCNNAQMSVDRLVYGYNSQSSKLLSDEPVGPTLFMPAIVEAASCVAALLRAVGHRLADDCSLIAAHSAELQAFDVAAQALEAMQPHSDGRSGDHLSNAVAACGQLLRIIESADRTEAKGKFDPERVNPVLRRSVLLTIKRDDLGRSV